MGSPDLKHSVAFAVAMTTLMGAVHPVSAQATAPSAAATADNAALPDQDAQLDKTQLHTLLATTVQVGEGFTEIKPDLVPVLLSTDLLDRSQALGKANSVTLDKERFFYNPQDDRGDNPVVYGHKNAHKQGEDIFIDGDISHYFSVPLPAANIPYTMEKDIQHMTRAKGDAAERVYYYSGNADANAPPVPHSYELQKGVNTVIIDGKIPSDLRIYTQKDYDTAVANQTLTPGQEAFGTTPEGRKFLEEFKASAIARGLNPPPQLFVDELEKGNDARTDKVVFEPPGSPHRYAITVSRALIDTLGEKTGNLEDTYKELAAIVAHEKKHIIDGDLSKGISALDLATQRNLEYKADDGAPAKELIDSYRSGILGNYAVRDAQGKPNADHPPTLDRVTNREVRALENGELSAGKDTGYLPDAKAITTMVRDGYYTPVPPSDDKLTQEIRQAARREGIATEGPSGIKVLVDNIPDAPEMGAAVTQDGKPLLFLSPQMLTSQPKTFSISLLHEMKEVKELTQAVGKLQKHDVILINDTAPQTFSSIAAGGPENGKGKLSR